VIRLKVEITSIKGSWADVLDSTLTTVNKEGKGKEPSESFKLRMMLAEHSPIRGRFFKWKWYDLESWISVHFVRHKIGIEHFVRTQRTDRTGIDRRLLSQSELIEHEAEANTQALINISRKRLCYNASKETREAWKEVINAIGQFDDTIPRVCVADCVYRGYCYEMKSCGFDKSPRFQQELELYRLPIEEWREQCQKRDAEVATGLL